jgi:hypothetical protein
VYELPYYLLANHPVYVKIHESLSESKIPEEAASQEGQEETARDSFPSHHILGARKDVYNIQNSSAN